MVKEINDRYLELWEEHVGKGKVDHHRWPLLYGDLRCDCVLFVGLNPSFNESYIEKRKQGKKILQWTGRDQEKRQTIRNMQAVAKGRAENKDGKVDRYRYFKSMQKFIEELNKPKLEWEHIDLFPIRESTQSELKQHLELKTRKTSYHEKITKVCDEFGKSLLKTSFHLIREINPNIIVVANAQACKIFLWYMTEVDNSLTLEWCDEAGTYLSKVNNSEIPTFLSGMLSGQRALDLGSRKRLFWHIEKLIVSDENCLLQ